MVTRAGDGRTLVVTARREVGETRGGAAGDTWKAVEERIPLDPTKTAVVIVDMWNYHWCRTWVGRACAMIPRMNRVLDVARRMGMRVIHAPTDVANTYAGWEQRERMAALPQRPIPGLELWTWPSEERMRGLPEPPWWDGEMCAGAFACVPNYGEYKLHPELVIHPDDWISASGQDVYNLCARDGIENLIYVGGATNICLVRKPEGMINMSAAGLRCLLARDVTEAHSVGPDSEALDRNTAVAVRYVERHIAPSLDIVEAFREAGAWRDEWIVDQVLVSPWGHPSHPQLFEASLEVTMSVPRLPGARVRYTLDGGEPTATSRAYTGPVRITETTVLRATAFRDDRQVARVSDSHYLRIPPAPPAPTVHLSDLEPVWATVRAHIPWWVHPEQGTAQPPVRDRAYDGTPLTNRGASYERGMGVDTPSQMVFELRPAYRRFVALAGVCESLLSRDLGRETAAFAQVVFRVFVDGKWVAESRLMTISEVPWRFNVEIPAHSRVISLVTTSPIEGGTFNLANWLNAGFLVG